MPQTFVSSTLRTPLSIAGRVLFLSADPSLILQQLSATDTCTLEQAQPLRDEISTDEITPIPSLSYFDQRLGEHVYTGLKAGNTFPVSKGAVKQAKVGVIVAGKRYGKGSSREHSPMAEKYAGVQIVFAESFERIYRQNADNVGLLTSSNFSLLDKLLAGQVLALEDFFEGRDSTTVQVLRAGGLMRYGADFMRAYQIGLPPMPPWTGAPMGEKILRRSRYFIRGTRDLMQAGESMHVRPDWRFIHEIYTGMAAHLLEQEYGPDYVLTDSNSIVTFADHFSYTHKSPAHIANRLLPDIKVVHDAHNHFAEKHKLLAHGNQIDAEGSEGICHPLMTELYALPGQLVVGTDSHTPHIGALGCIAFGVGTTDMANAMITGTVRVTMPEFVRIEFKGTLSEGVSSKDMVLQLLQHPVLKRGAGLGKIFEFCGEGVRALGIDDRATLTNMTAELGGFTGFVAPDEKTIAFLKERRGIDFKLEHWMYSDSSAYYHVRLEMECRNIEAMVSRPGDPGNAIRISALGEFAQISDRPPVDIAYGGSCTGGKRADFDAYAKVFQWAKDNGIALPKGVRAYLQFGTSSVREYARTKGYIDLFNSFGIELLEPSCGACANLGPGSSEHPDQVTISSQNRNFPGRSGPGKLWLASPLTVAASALAGHVVSFDELKAKQ